MARVKITEGPWKGQEGEFVRQEDGTEQIVSEHAEAGGPGETPRVAVEFAKTAGKVVVRMPGNRLVEFDAENVDTVVSARNSARPPL